MCVCVEDILVSVQHEDTQAHNTVAGYLNLNGTVYVCLKLTTTFYILSVQPTRCDVSQFLFFCKTLYVLHAVFPYIIRSSKLHIQRQVFVRPILLPAASQASSR